ncbi:DUF6600 domain-containing protein [Frateuria hangzhouensis]|uniref:DUF6600 domain-containing protein n=1 Tax=Frateuria hangzhouensis TaxID=2995589 RepID=UPI002260EECE|nr:DUF6600 domain-containing protein [Frateuria sp. STR12]MCX7513953.1 hypothetical protein [Frateuria sp. STR12]
MHAPSKWQLTWRSCVATVLLCMAGALPAETLDDSGDPPDRVARLSWLGGDVGLLPAGAQEWGEAGLNRPLTTGDRLSSSDGARAELELDSATLRLDGRTDVGFLQLDGQLAQLELTQGTLSLAVRQLDAGQSYEIDTPTVALVVDQPGRFRVDVDADGQATRVTAFDGSATVYGENDAQRRVIAGRSYRFADSLLAGVTLQDIAGGDDFDAWNDERDRRYADSESRRYVSEDVIGYQDLDRYGDWRSDPEYGQVWYPAHVDTGWAPYRNGHWAWVGPWGWTWVDDAPWGFAPYHYGRWAWRGGGWCWVPGPTGWRPVYAPALVAFVGGNRWSVSVGSRPVGWYPLGPGEVYDPWYRGSHRYYTQVNVTNIHVRNTVVVDRVDHRYRNWHRGIAPPVRALHRDGPRGFTAMPARNFVGADRVQRHRLKIDPARLRDASLQTRNATPRPTPHSFAPPRSPKARPLPAKGFRREVVARHAPRAVRIADRAHHAGPHAAPPHVRVLRPRGDTLPAVARIAPAPRAGTREAPRAAVRSGGRGTQGVDARSRPVPREVPLRPGELRSARFVRAHAAREATPPRPGVSFISTAEGDRERAARTAPTLPRVSRLQPADTPRAPARRPDAGNRPRLRAPQIEAATRAGRIEAARQRQTPPRQVPARGNDRAAHLRAPGFAAPRPIRASPPQRSARPPEYRQARPLPHAAPRPRAPAPSSGRAHSAPAHAPAARARHESARRFDRKD